MLSSNFLRNLTSIARRIEHAQQQLATGKAILKPSDGPIQVARILQYNLSLSQITQFKMNIGDGIIRARFRDSIKEEKLMAPGTTYEFTIKLYPTSNIFKKGHRRCLTDDSFGVGQNV